VALQLDPCLYFPNFHAPVVVEIPGRINQEHLEGEQLEGEQLEGEQLHLEEMLSLARLDRHQELQQLAVLPLRQVVPIMPMPILLCLPHLQLCQD
jgi:hypothetical protein